MGLFGGAQVCLGLHSFQEGAASPLFQKGGKITRTADAQCRCGGAGAQPDGYREMTELVAFYKENANILRSAFLELGFSVYGGANAPYVWVGFPGQARLARRGSVIGRAWLACTPAHCIPGWTVRAACTCVPPPYLWVCFSGQARFPKHCPTLHECMRQALEFFPRVC